MRAVLQRVSGAKVVVDGAVAGEIARGFLVLLGVGEGDTDEDLHYLVKKILALRVFADGEGKMNLSLGQVDGELLLVSQFTLYADTRKGNRPSFIAAAKPDAGRNYYEKAIAAFRAAGMRVATGVFGADMQVSLTNDGPVTIMIDSRER